MKTCNISGHVCPWWLAYTFDNRFRRFFHNPEQILGPYTAKGMTVLDVGCGMGFFSIGLARLVGDNGSVVAADLQPQMLKTLKKRAEKAGVSKIIRLHQSQTNQLGVATPVDFILAFWMVHEVRDPKSFFNEIYACLKPNGRLLIAEPKFHVPLKRFQEILDFARDSGLTRDKTASIRLSWAAVFNKG